MHKVLLGAAGTGKSWTIKSFLESDPKYCIKTATTGIAAINLQDSLSSATTINSLLAYYDSADLLFKSIGGELDPRLHKVADLGYKYICIDEVSMMDAAQLDLIYMRLALVNKERTSLGKNPLYLLLVGDFAQLPPVQGKPVFNAKCWPQFEKTVLKEVKRQDNKDFIKALGDTRLGKAEEAYDYFSTKVGLESKVDDNFVGSTFFSTNNKVDEYNAKQLLKLKTKSRYYFSDKDGPQRTEWKAIPNELELKEGALVVILFNDHKQGYCNGDLAYVENCNDDSVEVSLVRNGNLVTINYIKLTTSDDSSRGYIKYIPLRVAYAMSIHKSQSLTLDRVQISVGDGFISRCHGMLYVALSRCRTKEGLRIVGNKDGFIRSVFVSNLYKSYIE